MKKLLVICGPTATGKTNLALRLASSIGRSSSGRKKFKGELVSADSRQVYVGMDIGTGKDLPKNSKFQKSKTPSIGGFYEVDGVKIWGYDLVDPKEGFSVAQYLKIAEKMIEDIWKREKLPILVGGTGLYIKGVVDGIATVTIPRNVVLRKYLEEKNAKELFEMLATLDPIKAGSMNLSDRKNPRRLIRAIEIADRKIKSKGGKDRKLLADDVLIIGLISPNKVLNGKIDKRVDKRIKQGFEDEIRALFKKGLSWDKQSMTSLGYRQWRDFIEGLATKDEVLEKWKREEKKYAKRQITWFKKDKRINWFDITKKGWEKEVEKLVKEWYKKEG